MEPTEDPLSNKLMKLAGEGSGQFLSYLDSKEVSYDGLADLDLGRKLVEDRYGFDEKEFKAVDFVFWTSYFTEREASELIIYPELVGVIEEHINFICDQIPEDNTKMKKECEKLLDRSLDKDDRKDVLESVIGELYFGSKIKIIEHFYESKENPFIKMMRKIQVLRNRVAHGRLSELTYGSYHLSTGKGQLMFIVDLMDAASTKGS